MMPPQYHSHSPGVAHLQPTLHALTPNQAEAAAGPYGPAALMAMQAQQAIQAQRAMLAQQAAMPRYLSYAQLVKRRSGKWTLEETEYAELLIELFEKGQVLDEKNGATLRSFLSRKLFCAPMRISKKFAGQGIGKKVFSSKVNSPFLDVNKPPPASFYSNMTRLREKETKFLKVAFPDLPGLINSGFAGPFVAGMQVPFLMNVHTPAALPTHIVPQGFVPQIAPVPPSVANMSEPSQFQGVANSVRTMVQSSASCDDNCSDLG
ncbi:MAG: hypothetical protein SGARI_003829 [Bacillariaceae sp.]